VHLTELFLHAQGAEFRATGDYISHVPEPVSLSFYFTHVPRDIVDESELPISGKLLTEGHVGGTLDPRKLTFTGTMRSENLVVGKRPFGDIRGLLEGAVTDEQANFKIRDLSLLGGQWTVAGVWPYDAKDKMADSEVLRVKVGVEHLALKDVG